MKWTKQHIDFLIENYPNKGMSFCSKKLNRTKESIYSKVKELKIKRNSIRETKNWLIEDINYLLNNYSKLGSLNCSKFLNKSSVDVSKKANSLNLKINERKLNEIKKENGFKIRSNKVPYENFLKFNTKEIVYILGLIWGDGNLNVQYNRISINMSENDIKTLIPIFKKTGDWNISKPYEKYFKGKRVKNQITITTYNIIICSKLKDCDYYLKSKKSAIKIN